MPVAKVDNWTRSGHLVIISYFAIIDHYGHWDESKCKIERSGIYTLTFDPDGFYFYGYRGDKLETLPSVMIVFVVYYAPSFPFYVSRYFQSNIWLSQFPAP